MGEMCVIFGENYAIFGLKLAKKFEKSSETKFNNLLNFVAKCDNCVKIGQFWGKKCDFLMKNSETKFNNLLNFVAKNGKNSPKNGKNSETKFNNLLNFVAFLAILKQSLIGC